MFFNYSFWHYLTNPQELADKLQTNTMRGFKKKVVVVFIVGILIFAIRNIWGMNTASLTQLLTTMTTQDYSIARFTSLAGAIIWALIYISFHFFGVAFILSRMTKIPYKHLLPLQLLATGVLLIEKLLVFIVFLLTGTSASVSFLSLGPLAITFLENWYMILFLNQLTITMALIIAIQFRFIQAYLEQSKKTILWILFLIQIVFALITAGVGFIPVEKIINVIIGGGA